MWPEFFVLCMFCILHEWSNEQLRDWLSGLWDTDQCVIMISVVDLGQQLVRGDIHK